MEENKTLDDSINFEEAKRVLITGDDGTVIDMVEEPIMSGGESAIHWGRIRENDYMIKSIKPFFDDEEDEVARFKKTSALMANIEDPSISAKVWGMVVSEGKYYLVLYPYFQSETNIQKYKTLTLKDLLKTPDTPLTKEQKLDIIMKLAELVTKLHKRGLYHMDLKPGNILYYDDFVKLIDFTLLIDRRNVSDDKKLPDPQNFRTGTPQYCSPERLLMANQIGEDPKLFNFYASEIFTLGVIAFELLTGELFYANKDWTGLMDDIMSFDLNDKGHPVTMSFYIKMSDIEGYSAEEKDLLINALEMILDPEPSKRVSNFETLFIQTLQSVLD